AMRLEWDDRRLLFAVREPFVSRHSSADVVAGMLDDHTELRIESHMPTGGVIFSDGIESDYLAFDSGAVAHVRPAMRRAMLVANSVQRAEGSGQSTTVRTTTLLHGPVASGF